MRRCAAALILVLTCITLLSSQQTKVLAPHRPIAPRLPDNPPKSGPLRSMVGGLWMTDANFKSSIYIKSDLESSPLTVTPLLYLSNGKKLTLPNVNLEAAGTAVISVNDALDALGIASWTTLTGYVEIQYKWPWDPLCVTVTSVDTVHSVIFTNGLRPSLPSNSIEEDAAARGSDQQVLEGMWWKQEPNVTAFVALSNTTDRPIKAHLDVSDNLANSLGTHSVMVSPHGTKTVTLAELQSALGVVGGLRVTYYRSVNQMLVNGGLEDQASGSAGLPFVSVPSIYPQPAMQTYTELGLMNGAADPMMQFPAGTTFIPYSLLRNISAQPATVTPSIYWMQGDRAHSAKLPSLTLLPYQAQSLNIPALLAASALQNFNAASILFLMFRAPC